MEKETEDSTREHRIGEIIDGYEKLDDVCAKIFFALLMYKNLRFNELRRYLKKLGTDITKQSMIDHLKHLRKTKFISIKRGFQRANYSLKDEINSLLDVPEEEVREWVENDIAEDEKLDKKLRLLQFDENEYYNKLPEEQLDEEIDKRIHSILAHSLFELKTLIEYDLKLPRPESDKAFWKFIGNPMYRMQESNIAETCRNNERYREKLFAKIDAMVNELRPDKELLKQREERRNKQVTK